MEKNLQGDIKYAQQQHAGEGSQSVAGDDHARHSLPGKINRENIGRKPPIKLAKTGSSTSRVGRPRGTRPRKRQSQMSAVSEEIRPMADKTVRRRKWQQWWYWGL